MATTIQAMQPATVPNGACYPPFPMSIEQYEKLIDSGVFRKRDKLPLINGILVAKVTQNPPHSVADLLCSKALARVIPVGWHLRPEKPVRLPPDCEPEPDQCVVRGGRARLFATSSQRR
jgi:Uma2 family endonuclease